MKFHPRGAATALFVVALFGISTAPAWAVDYTITDLGTLGGTSSYANGLNNSGQVVGRSANSTGTQYAFLYSNSTMINLGTLSTSYNSSAYNPQSEAYGINNSGQVVGGTLNGSGHAFLYSNGTMTDISGNGPILGGVGNATAFGINNNGQAVGNIYSSPLSNNCFCNWHTLATFLPPSFTSNGGLTSGLGTLPGGTGSEAHGINDNRQVVGWSGGSTTGFADQYSHAILWQNGVMTDLGTLAGNQFTSHGFGINNNGWVVGDSQIDSFINHAFLYRNGVMIDLGTLNPALSNQGSVALGINNNGQVVGYSVANPSTNHGFLWQNGVLTDLNNLLSPTSGWILNGATGINDLGQITGNGTINGQIHAYLMTPTSVPIPAAVWLFGSGLLGLVGIARRKAA